MNFFVYLIKSKDKNKTISYVGYTSNIERRLMLVLEKITKKKFGNDNKLYDVLSSLREKINAPTKRKK